MTVRPPLVEAVGLVKDFPFRGAAFGGRGARLRALAGVDFVIDQGEIVALVGESGSGKTTLGRCLTLLESPTAGEVRVEGERASLFGRKRIADERRRLQTLFQNATQSLDPRRSVGASIAEAFARGERGRRERAERVAELLTMVGLSAGFSKRYPHEISGGQRQRVGLARALAARPTLLVADEPTASLDVSLRGQILDLLRSLTQTKEGESLTLLLIAHDLAAVAHLAQRVVVLYWGTVVEMAPTREFFERPLHPYSIGLLASEFGSSFGARREALPAGDPPDPLERPLGCPYAPRCPLVRERCTRESPKLTAPSSDGLGRSVACFYPSEAERLLDPTPTR